MTKNHYYDLGKMRFLISPWKLMMLFSLMAFSFGFAQNEKTIEGTVTASTDGMPIPGVNVIARGTSNGTATDFDGKYSIEATSEDILVFSYVGYKSQEIPVGEQTTLDVVLSEDFTQLSEVTVTSIGYGKVERREITSAVASVDSDEFNKGNVNSPAELLQGKVAGLSIARPGGDPNAGFSIRLR